MSDENRARGFKATISNPRTSDEAKQHAREELDNLGQGKSYEAVEVIRQAHHSSGTTKSSQDKNEGNVLGGYKATLKNPRVSEQAKEHAQEVLEDHGVDIQ